MWRINLQLILLVFLLFRCGSIPSIEPIPEGYPPVLSVTNISEYDIKRLYIYQGSKGDYKNSEDYIAAFFDDDIMNADESIDFEENKFDGSFYITFVRDISSTSVGEVAITTEEPLSIESGHYYLYLLEDDFTYKVTEE